MPSTKYILQYQLSDVTVMEQTDLRFVEDALNGDAASSTIGDKREEENYEELVLETPFSTDTFFGVGSCDIVSHPLWRPYRLARNLCHEAGLASAKDRTRISDEPHAHDKMIWDAMAKEQQTWVRVGCQNLN